MKFLGRFQKISPILIATILMMTIILSATAQTNPRVYMFDVVGNEQIETAKILGVVSNTKIGDPLDPKKIQLDMRAIMGLGFFSDVQITTEKMSDGIKLNFVVFENPPFKEVQVTGLTKVKPEELQQFFSQKSGEIFNTVTFGEDLMKLKNYCREKQGLFVESKTPGVNLAPDGTVQLELVELKYGKTVVLGLVKTKEQVVLRELSIKEGDIIDYNELTEEYGKLTRLRLFDGIDLRWEKSLEPEKMDLIIEVKEAQTGTFEVGMSYGEQSGEVGGFIRFTEGNLVGLGQSVSLDLSFNKDSNNIKFSFYEPWLDDKHTSFGMSLWNSESEIDSTMKKWYPSNVDYNGDGQFDDDTKEHELDLDRTGLSLSLGRQFWKNTTARLRLNFEENTITKITDRIKDEVQELDDDGNPVLDGDGNPKMITVEKDVEVQSKTFERPLQFWDNSVQLELIRNKLVYADSQFVSGGHYLSGGYTIAGDILGGEFDYNKLALEGKWFKTLLPNLVWGTRLQGTYLTGDYPDYNALYLGGMYKLRGYDDDRFDDEETKKLIGDQTLLLNTELRYRLPFNDKFEMVLFYDAGQVNNTNTADNYGMGVRINIPFLGMLRFDQAWGGQEDKFIFSLGEMF